MATVAIITPCYNAARYIEQTIISILAQTYTDWEYLLVDDGSTDATPSLLGRYAAEHQQIRVVQQQNQGVARARNTGAATASADTRYLLFLDHDDLLYPNALYTLVTALDAHPEQSAVFGDYTPIDAQGNLIGSEYQEHPIYCVEGKRVRKQHNVKTLNYAHIAAVIPFDTPGQCLIRASSFAQTAGFDQATAPCDDWDILLQLSRIAPLGRISDPVMHWRSHPEQTTHKHALMQAKRHYVYEKFLQLTANNPAQHTITEIAYPFGMFDLDAQLCGEWSLQSVAKRQYGNALRYLVRGIQYRSRSAMFRARRTFAH